MIKESKIKVFDFSKKAKAKLPARVQKKPIKRTRSLLQADPNENQFKSHVDQLHRVQGKSPDEVIAIMRALGTSDRELAKIPRYLGQLKNKFTVATSTEIALNENIRLILLKKKLVLTEIQLDPMITELKQIIRKYIK